MLELKTNWKQPWQEKGSRVLRILVGIIGLAIPLHIVIALLLGNDDFFDALFDGNVFLLVFICFFLVLITGYISAWIPMLITYFYPETYEISKESGLLRIVCNKKEKLCVRIADIDRVAFVRRVLGRYARVPLGSVYGDEMDIYYRIQRPNGRFRKKCYTMDFRWFRDEDRSRLYAYMRT